VILYPLFAVLALAAVGGGYQTVRDTQDRRQISRGNAVKARMSSRASSRCAATAGNLASRAVTTWWR
jgi:hypothetical protein